ncbi:hypothetical protein PIROE2DRAFT_20175 [Piromyces sp. E2]|nr:hypothetical protein PIROE2DRAFT_20175 [Piromyces sp. E2]|eukprot:OUM66375.1 hypothetical protein PIROE2DRAFT_20175 [Piromyces sp. E2]
MNVITGQALFNKFIYLRKEVVNPDYKITIMPGYKKGISGSTVGGYNIGINKYLDSNKKDAAVKVVTFMTSKEAQRDIVVNNFKILSGISSLYEEGEEICNENKDLCEYYKKIQPVNRPISKVEDYTRYSEKLRSIVYKYLYGNEQPEIVLKELDDVTRFYYLSVKSTWGIDLLINVLAFVKPYEVFDVIIDDGKNYQKCFVDSSILSSFQYFLAILNVFIIACSLVLSYAEWNIGETYYEIRYYMTIILMDSILFIIYVILKVVGINEYFSYFITRENSVHKEMQEFKKSQNEKFSTAITSSITDTKSTTTRSQIVGKLMEYHNHTSVSSEDALSTSLSKSMSKSVN